MENIKKVREYYENGTLSYTCNIKFIQKNKVHLFENVAKDLQGKHWIRFGLHAKYYDNGQMAWCLSYLNNGKLIKKNRLQYRKDGTIKI